MGPPSAPPAQSPLPPSAPTAKEQAAVAAKEAAKAAKVAKENEQAAKADWASAPNGVKDGYDCFLVCGSKPGACDDYCGMPGLWAGMCCKMGATGNQTAPECESKGCIGFHCCVSAPLSGNSSNASGESPEPNPAHKYHKPEWSQQDLVGLFKSGKPSNHLNVAGLLVHGFDGTELNEAHRWMPCDTGFCKGALKYWSPSVINQHHPATWGANGLVFSPSRTKVLCSHFCDFGSLNSGCDASAPDGFNGTAKPYPPDHLKDMLGRSMYADGLKNAYNEVLIDMNEYVNNLPHSVAGFYYKENADAHAQVEAAHAYVAFLDNYNLTEESIPLLKFGADMESSHAILDVSGGARMHAARYAAMHDKWRKNHPYLVDHQEAYPTYVREQAAQRGEYLPFRQHTIPADWVDLR